MKRIVVCMGSSCFARDNRTNLQMVEEFLHERDLFNSVRVEGTLCTGECNRGPVICIDDKWYYNVTPDNIREILNKAAE